MGGKAFNPENLLTPRMPPSIYHAVKSRITAILHQHFRHADSPIDGPGKTDFGDIDILVFDPIDPRLATDYAGLASIVGAKQWKRIPGNDTVNFAVPYPPSSPRDKAEEEKFIQLDICIVNNLSKFHWLLFLHAHGDLFMVLGQSLRRFGFSLTPSGFHLHIPEIEGQNKGLSRVKITDEPKLVLGYLGLDEEVFYKGAFGEWDDMLGYAASSRFLDLGRGSRKREYERVEAEEKAKMGAEAGAEAEGDGTSGPDTPTPTETPAQPQDPTTTDAKPAPSTTTQTLSPISGDPIPPEENGGPALKANDRQRERKRPLFAYYLNEYIPKHGTLDTPPGSAAKLTKQVVIEDAKAYFGSDFAERYEEAREKAMRTVGLSQLWVRVREMVKQEGGEGDTLGYGMKGIKKAVEGELEGHVGEGAAGLTFGDVVEVRKMYEEMKFDDVVKWAKGHWRQVGEVQRGIDNVNGAKKLGEKKMKKESKEAVEGGDGKVAE